MAKKKSKGGPKLPPMLALGASAVGAGAAYVARRRRAGGQEEAQPTSPADVGGQSPPPTPAAAAPEPTAMPDSTTPHVTTASSEAAGGEPGDALHTPEVDPSTLTPAGDTDEVVMPDTSADDPLVREQTAAAAAEAGSVGGNVQEMAESEPGFPEDPATRPVIEGSGDAEETFEATDEELGGNRQTRP